MGQFWEADAGHFSRAPKNAERIGIEALD